jgi:hypothetical protein
MSLDQQDSNYMVEVTYLTMSNVKVQIPNKASQIQRPFAWDFWHLDFGFILTLGFWH